MDDLVADATPMAPATTGPSFTEATGPASTDPDRPGDTDPARPAGLSERELQILEFERHWWRHAGSKEQAIRDRFDISPTRYYQLLNALIDSPDALAHDPTLVKRLRRLRSSRSRARSARRFGGHPDSSAEPAG